MHLRGFPTPGEAELDPLKPHGTQLLNMTPWNPRCSSGSSGKSIEHLETSRMAGRPIGRYHRIASETRDGIAGARGNWWRALGASPVF